MLRNYGFDTYLYKLFFYLVKGIHHQVWLPILLTLSIYIYGYLRMHKRAKRNNLANLVNQ